MDYKIIKKGEINSPTIDGFISVTHFLMVKENNQKFLLLKFLNNRDETITGLRLEINQKDSRGVTICTFEQDFYVSNGEPLLPFVLDKKISVVPQAIDFDIKILSADFGNYSYAPCGNRLALSFKDQPISDITVAQKLPKGIDCAVSLRKTKFPALICLAMFVVLALTSAITFYQVQGISRSNTFFHMGVQYAFEENDKSEDSRVFAIGHKSDLKDVVIPKKIKNHTVTRIAANAFNGNTKIRSVVIDGDIAIGEWAFYNCYSLVTAEIENVSEIGDFAFRNCISLKEVNAFNLDKIGQRAFDSCRNLTNVKIANNKKVLEMGQRAFSNCSNLSVFDIDQFTDYSYGRDFLFASNNVKKLHLKNYNYSFVLNGENYVNDSNRPLTAVFGLEQTGAHYGLDELVIDFCGIISDNFCHGLAVSSVTIKNLGSPTVGAYAFYDCQNLQTLNIPQIAAVYNYAFSGAGISHFDGRNLNYVGDFAFSRCARLSTVSLENNKNLQNLSFGLFSYSALTEIFIPSTITTIPARAFEACPNLTKVTGCENLTEIGESTFADCESLSQVPLENVKKIGAMSFIRCLALKTLNFSENLESIETSAFSSCSGLTSVIVPDNTSKIGWSVFFDCSALESINLPFIGESRVSNNDYFAYIFGAARGSNETGVPRSLKKITIRSASEISQYAFYNCNKVKEIIIEKDLVHIANSAFYSCKNLNNFIIPATVTSIGSSAFAYCYKLYEVYNLSELNIVRNSTAFGGVGFYALSVYRSLDETKIPRISQDSFEFLFDSEQTGSDGVWYLVNYTGEQTAIDLPQDLWYSGERVVSYDIIKYLFADNDVIREVNITDDTHTIWEYAFLNSLVLDITVSSGVSLIKKGAFAGCNLEKITVPFIGESFSDNLCFAYIFGASDRSESYYVPSYLKTVTLTEGTNISPYAFYNCNYLRTVNLPDTIEKIGEGAFQGCVNLREIVLPYSLQIIENNAFDTCQSLTTATFVGDGVTIIEENVFSDCYSLENIDLPSGIVYIGREAFKNCRKLYSITLPEGLLEIAINAFLGCFSLCDVINLSQINIQAGTTDYGYVAYYALHVNTYSTQTLETLVMGGCRFMLFEGEWYLIYADSDLSSLTLPEAFYYDTTQIIFYTLREAAFGERSYHSIYIPRSVTNIQTEPAGNYYIGTVYYQGDEEQWAELIKAIPNSTLARCVILYGIVQE